MLDLVILHLLPDAALITCQTERTNGDVLDLADDQGVALHVVRMSIAEGGFGASRVLRILTCGLRLRFKSRPVCMAD
jgi:hypothetical protein